jgi:aldehyde dehydrogenase (NAD+)
LIGAIAAGNSAVIKPSELSVATEQALVELIPRYLDSNFYQVITGDIPVVTALLALRWDKIFFTGSTRVGRIIAKAAAEHLTPVSLELGGKSPTIIDQSVGDLELAAMRVMWGKNVNAGQTCIAPDYLFVHEKVSLYIGCTPISNSNYAYLSLR